MSSEFPKVLTPQDVADLLQITPEAVVDELEAGRMTGFKVGDVWRCTDQHLLQFMGASAGSPGSRGTEPVPRAARPDPILPGFEFTWRRTGPFTFRWPTRAGERECVERYSDAVEGIASRIGRTQRTSRRRNRRSPNDLDSLNDMPSRRKRLRIGFTTRDAAGLEDRQRAVIFLARGESSAIYPLVEFAGANDFEQSRRMASVIKLENRKQLKPGETIPPEYEGFTTAVYSDIVTGPYASNGMAVVVQEDDFDAMARHALIRLKTTRIGGSNWPIDPYDDGSP